METLKLDARIETREPRVLIDPALPPGRYIAQLVVVGPSGTSQPAQIVITVVRD